MTTNTRLFSPLNPQSVPCSFNRQLKVLEDVEDFSPDLALPGCQVCKQVEAMRKEPSDISHPGMYYWDSTPDLFFTLRELAHGCASVLCRWGTGNALRGSFSLRIAAL